MKIEFADFSSQASTKAVIKQLGELQNIQGKYFRSPGESLEKELQAFSSTKHNVDLWTYEFTQKDFKSVLKTLASNGVNIRIIVEDNKFQQFQNTLKELMKYFS